MDAVPQARRLRPELEASRLDRRAWDCPPLIQTGSKRFEMVVPGQTYLRTLRSMIAALSAAPWPLDGRRLGGGLLYSKRRLFRV